MQQTKLNPIKYADKSFQQKLKRNEKNKKEANFTIRKNVFKISNIEKGKTQGSHINIVFRRSRGLYHIDILSYACVSIRLCHFLNNSIRMLVCQKIFSVRE